MAANGSAEIVDMADARARLSAEAEEFEHVGLRLAFARESLGITLTDAATRTHIRETHLAAIEAVEISDLPARPYALGFVKTYAEFLELEARPIVERFKLDAGYDAPQSIETEKFRAADEAAEAQPGDMTLPVFIAILAFILWCAWQITLTATVTPIGNAADGAGISNDVNTGAPKIASPAPEPVIGDVVGPILAERIEPVYPRSCAAGAQENEFVTVLYTVTASGRVGAERIASSSNECFDEAALNAVRRWRYEPRTVDGAPRPTFDLSRQFTFSRP